jgi:hypothetical protein
VHSLKQIGLATALVTFLAAPSFLLPGTASANGCTLADVDVTDFDFCQGELVVPNADFSSVCLGKAGEPTDCATTQLNCNIVIKDGGVVKIGGDDRDTCLNGNIEMEGGFLDVRREVNGNIEAEGDAEIDLARQAVIHGNVELEDSSVVDFKGNIPKNNPNAGAAKVFGNVEIEDDATLLATGKNEKNLVTGNIECDEPIPGATATDWDGDGEKDGTVGGNFECVDGDDDDSDD